MQANKPWLSSESPAEKAERFLDGIQVVMEKVVRILIRSKDTKLSIRSLGVGGNVPAYTDGKDIFVNRDHLNRVLSKGISASALSSTKIFEANVISALLLVKGLCYHELAHLLITPRDNSDFMGRLKGLSVNSTILRHRFNVLEDQRIEMFFGKLYPLALKYFEQAIATFLLDQGVQTDGTEYQYLYGRKFIDPEILANSRKMFVANVGEDRVRNIEEVIDEYLTVKFPDDTIRAVELVRKFAYLFVQPPFGQNSCHQATDKVLDEFNQGSPNRDAQNKGLPKTQEKSDTESKPSDKNEDGNGADDGSDSGTSPAVANNVLLREVVEAFNQDVQVQADVRGSLEATKKHVAGTGVGKLPGVTSQRPCPFTIDMRIASKGLVTVMRDIKFDLEPTILHRQTNGRVNLNRLLQAQPGDLDLFDQWQDDLETECGVEACLAVDVSGSTRHIIEMISQALWVIKQSFSELDVPTTVLAFHSSGHTLFKRKEVVSKATYPLLTSMGGTQPQSCITEAHDILAVSEFPNRVFMVLTDGEWPFAYGSAAPVDPYIEKMRVFEGINTTTMLVGLDLAVRRFGSHGFMLAEDIRNIGELPKVFTGLVRSVMRDAMAKVISNPT